MNTYIVEVHEYGQKMVQAKSRSAAKYAAYLDYDVTGGLGFKEYLKWIKSVRLVHKFRPSDLYGDVDQFERMKAARNIPFAFMGQKVVLSSQNRGEMVGTIVHQLTRNLNDEQIKTAGFDTYFVDHTTGVYPQFASGYPWSASTMQVTGDVIADLTEDLAADGAMV